MYSKGLIHKHLNACLYLQIKSPKNIVNTVTPQTSCDVLYFRLLGVQQTTKYVVDRACCFLCQQTFLTSNFTA